MGIRILSISSFEVEKGAPNPDPSKYRILYSYQLPTFFAVTIEYEGCTNTEGKKILVFKGKYEDLIAQKVIDPHFSFKKTYMSPIARFTPTEEGWSDAMEYCNRKEGKFI